MDLGLARLCNSNSHAIYGRVAGSMTLRIKGPNHFWYTESSDKGRSHILYPSDQFNIVDP